MHHTYLWYFILAKKYFYFFLRGKSTWRRLSQKKGKKILLSLNGCSIFQTVREKKEEGKEVWARINPFPSFLKKRVKIKGNSQCVFCWISSPGADGNVHWKIWTNLFRVFCSFEFYCSCPCFSSLCFTGNKGRCDFFRKSRANMAAAILSMRPKIYFTLKLFEIKSFVFLACAHCNLPHAENPYFATNDQRGRGNSNFEIDLAGRICEIESRRE